MAPQLSHSPLAALVGEALGEQEAQHGAPFVGPAGFLLTRLINWAGYSRSQFDIWNIIWCRPPNNHLEGAPYQQAASSHCMPHWADLPRRVNVLVPMGNVPLFNLLGKREVLTNRGYVFQRSDGKLVLPTVHPSYIQRGNTNYGRAFINDLQHAVDLTKNGFPATYRDYKLDPLPVDAERWVVDYEKRLANDPSLLLAYDIETPYKNEDEGELDGEDTRSILRIGFSYQEHTGLSIPFETPYFSLIRRLLESTGPKVVWNASFDNSHLQQAGFSIKGPIHDGMVAWHILHSDLPKGLGFVSTFTCWDQPEWKSTSHLAPARYNCLQRDTRLIQWDGTPIRIGEVVNKRLGVTLRGMDEAGRLIPVKVTNWFKSFVKDQPWLRIEVAASRQPIICTPEHRIWTQRGWVQAEHLQPGMRVILPRRGHESLIHGTLLGDASVDKRGRLHVAHGINQQEWCKRKHANLEGTKLHTSWHTAWGKEYQQISFDAWIPTEWRKRFYTLMGKQFIAPEDPETLATWYCDDGCLVNEKVARIALHGFVNAEEAKAWLVAKFGPIGWHNKLNAGFSAEASRVFFDCIASYVPPEMQYKLPLSYRNRYNGWLEESVALTSQVVAIEPYSVGPTQAPNMRFCVEVDHSTHRFFTQAGLVANCTDADVEQRSAKLILQQLRDASLWNVYERDVLQLEPILLHMHDVGMPIDAEVRKEKAKQLSSKLSSLKGEMNGIVPLGAKRLKVYKTKPKKLDFAYEWTEVEQLASVPTCINCGLEAPKKPHFKLFKKKVNPCGGKHAELVSKLVKRLARVEPFVPSRDQILRYQTYLGRELPTTWDPKEKKRKLSSNEKAITQLVKDYPQDKLYPLILVYRDAEKVAGTYIGKWDEGRGIVSGGFPVGLDGRIHTTFSHNPSSLRLSSFNPNLQNIPRGGEFGKWVKECFVAGHGKLFWSLDYSAIEAVLVGYFCGDPQMIRLAKLGVHAFLASHILGRPADLSWSEKELRSYFAELKATEKYTYDVAKRVVHSTNYLVTPKKLHMEFPLEFKSIKEAHRLQRIYLDLFPSLDKWHHTLCERVDGAKVRVNADDDPKTPWSLGVCHVVNPFGYKHDFYHVLNWEKINGEWYSTFGEDAKRLVSFLPQSTAAAILKDAVRRIWARQDSVAESLRLLIHDDITGEADESLVEMCLSVAKAEMEAPIRSLPLDPTWNMGEYLTIATEGKVGKSWATMH